MKSGRVFKNLQRLKKAVNTKFLLLKPQNFRKVIYIKSDNFVFDKKSYDSYILGKYISRQDYETIISELNKVVTRSFIENNKHEKLKVYRFVYFMIFISFVFFICGAFLLADAEAYNNKNKDTINLPYLISILLFLGSTVIILGLSINNSRHTSIQMVTIANTIHSFIKQYLSFLNVYFQGVLHFNYFQYKSTIELSVVDCENEDDEEGTKYNRFRTYEGIVHKRKKNEKIKKLEKMLEETIKEEDEMIHSKLFGNGWEEKNHVFDDYYYEDDKEIKSEKKSKKDNNNSTSYNNTNNSNSSDSDYESDLRSSQFGGSKKMLNVNQALEVGVNQFGEEECLLAKHTTQNEKMTPPFRMRKRASSRKGSIGLLSSGYYYNDNELEGSINGDGIRLIAEAEENEKEMMENGKLIKDEVQLYLANYKHRKSASVS